MKNQAVFYVVLGLLAALALWMLGPFIKPMLLAAILGYLLMPVYDRMGRYIASPQLRAVLLLLVVLFAVALPAVLALPKIISQARAALRHDTLIDEVARFNETLDRTFKRHVPLAENFAEYSQHVRSAMTHAAPELIGRIGTTAIDLVVFLYTLFFVLIEGPEILAEIVGLIPLDPVMKPHLVHGMEATMTGVLYGQVITAFVQAMLACIGYLAVGVPHVLLWTLLTMITAMLPIAGATLVWLPVAASRLLIGDAIGGWGLIAYMAILVGTVDHVLKPKLISGRAPLHPLAALVGVLGGLHFFGITGFLIGPMLLGLLAAMLTFYRELPHYSNRTP